MVEGIWEILYSLIKVQLYLKTIGTILVYSK